MYDLLYSYFREKTSLDRRRFQAIAGHFTLTKPRRNEHLLRAGAVCRHFYFVNSGCFRLYTTNEEGYELTRYFAFEGKFGTALSSFIEQKPSLEFIKCLEKSSLLAITRDAFFYLVEKEPAMNRVYRDILEMAYITSQKRIYGLQGETALDRLKWLLQYEPSIFRRISNKVIATYLGVTPYTLSRLKSEL